MFITALTKFTALDFPGHLACIIFTGGCNLRCGYCHNSEFVLPEKLKEFIGEKGTGKSIPFETVLNFLKARKGMLDGVVICGGEPTVQYDLLDRMREIKRLGFPVKLDTNGTNPEVLARALENDLVSYVAMDLKDALPYRKELVGVNVDSEMIRKSIKLIKNSGVDYEFRSTILPAFHNLEILKRMGAEIQGAKSWNLQSFRNGKTLNEKFEGLEEWGNTEMQLLKRELSEFAVKVEIR